VGSPRRASAPSRPSLASATAHIHGCGLVAAAGTSQTRSSVQASAGPRLRGSPSSVSSMPMCQSSISQVSAHQTANERTAPANGSRRASASAAHAAAPAAIHARIRRAVAGRAARCSLQRRWLAARKRAVARGV